MMIRLIALAFALFLGAPSAHAQTFPGVCPVSGSFWVYNAATGVMVCSTTINPGGGGAVLNGGPLTINQASIVGGLNVKAGNSPFSNIGASIQGQGTVAAPCSAAGCGLFVLFGDYSTGHGVNVDYQVLNQNGIGGAYALVDGAIEEQATTQYWDLGWEQPDVEWGGWYAGNSYTGLVQMHMGCIAPHGPMVGGNVIPSGSGTLCSALADSITGIEPAALAPGYDGFPPTATISTVGDDGSGHVKVTFVATPTSTYAGTYCGSGCLNIGVTGVIQLYGISGNAGATALNYSEWHYCAGTWNGTVCSSPASNATAVVLIGSSSTGVAGTGGTANDLTRPPLDVGQYSIGTSLNDVRRFRNAWFSNTVNAGAVVIGYKNETGTPGLLFNGFTSGVITVQPQAAAGTYNFNLPITAGTSGYLLTSAGGASSPMTWTNPSSLSIGLTVGTSTIASGTTGRILYDNGAVLGELASVPLTDLSTQATNTVLVNVTSGSASPTAQSVSGCSAAGSALKWTTNAGFGCNSAITASLYLGDTTSETTPGSGYVGEVLSNTATTQAITSGMATAVTSLSVPAGHWRCDGAVYSHPAGGTTQTAGGVSLNTSVANINAVPQEYNPGNAIGVVFGETSGPYFYNFTSPTTVYDVGYVVYSGSTLTVDGGMWCQRIF